MFGEFEITVILDGMWTFDGPHPTFGADRNADEVESLMKENFLPSDRMVGQFNPVLVNTGNDLILFDTGNGPEGREFGAGQLASRVAASGYVLSDVTIVALSHLHADHINGLMEGNRPAFSRGTVCCRPCGMGLLTSADVSGTPAAMACDCNPEKDPATQEKDDLHRSRSIE